MWNLAPNSTLFKAKTHFDYFTRFVIKQSIFHPWKNFCFSRANQKTSNAPEKVIWIFAVSVCFHWYFRRRIVSKSCILIILRDFACFKTYPPHLKTICGSGRCPVTHSSVITLFKILCEIQLVCEEIEKLNGRTLSNYYPQSTKIILNPYLFQKFIKR